MRRFICEQNVAHFERLLREATDPVVQRTVQCLLFSARREFAILNSVVEGAGAAPPGQGRRPRIDVQTVRQHLQTEFDGSSNPYMLLDPGPGLHIVDINEAYAAAPVMARKDVIGKSLFDVLPDNAEHPLAEGISNLYASLRNVVETGQPHAMAVQRYDVRTSSGESVERYWQPINTPIHDEGGQLIFLLHHVEDVTEHVLASRRQHDRQSDAQRPRTKA